MLSRSHFPAKPDGVWLAEPELSPIEDGLHGAYRWVLGTDSARDIQRRKRDAKLSLERERRLLRNVHRPPGGNGPQADHHRHSREFTFSTDEANQSYSQNRGDGLNAAFAERLMRAGV